MSYTELSIEERAAIQVGKYKELSQREIARMLGRSPSTISRELRRNGLGTGYSAYEAQTLLVQRKVHCQRRILLKTKSSPTGPLVRMDKKFTQA